MRLILGDQSIQFSKSEWERAKSLILDTEWSGDEGEMGVMTDEDSLDNDTMDPEKAMEFMQWDVNRILEGLKANTTSKVNTESTVLGPKILITGLRGQFKQQYRDAAAYLRETVGGENVESVKVTKLDEDHAQHSVKVNEPNNTEAS